MKILYENLCQGHRTYQIICWFMNHLQKWKSQTKHKITKSQIFIVEPQMQRILPSNSSQFVGGFVLEIKNLFCLKNSLSVAIIIEIRSISKQLQNLSWKTLLYQNHLSKTYFIGFLERYLINSFFLHLTWRCCCFTR